MTSRPIYHKEQQAVGLVSAREEVDNALAMPPVGFKIRPPTLSCLATAIYVAVPDPSPPSGVYLDAPRPPLLVSPQAEDKIGRRVHVCKVAVRQLPRECPHTR